MRDQLTVAAAAAMDKSIVDKLDQLLAGPNDRAYIVCSAVDCTLNIKGRCTIFTVLDVPKMKTGKRCDQYNNCGA